MLENAPAGRPAAAPRALTSRSFDQRRRASRLPVIRRIRSTRSAGLKASLTSTVSTPEFKRARSFASRSSAAIPPMRMRVEAAA